MRKYIPFILASFITLSTLPSCRKVYDFIRDHPDAHDTLCRITTISLNGFYKDPELIDITYNAKGDPYNMLVRDPVNYPGNLNSYFRYDRFGRLQYFIQNYASPGPAPTEPAGGLLFHKYAYPRKDFITDTFIAYAPGYPPNYADAGGTIKGYQLDQKGRIAKIYTLSGVPHQPPQLDGEITYDANGNLPLPSPDLSYDDKVNVYRTSKIWQFVFIDYRRNNVIKDDHFFFPAYNDFGLPLNIRNLESYYIYPFNLNVTGPEIDITYACSAPSH